MDFLPFVVALTWGVLYAISFGCLGAVYGALTRVIAFWGGHRPATSGRTAFGKGLKSGGLFLAVLGFGAGGLSGFISGDLFSPVAILIGLLFLTSMLMFGAIVFGGMAEGVVQLSKRHGSQAAGIVLALAIVVLGIALPIADQMVTDDLVKGDVSVVRRASTHSLTILAVTVLLGAVIGISWLCSAVIDLLLRALGIIRQAKPPVQDGTS